MITNTVATCVRALTALCCISIVVACGGGAVGSGGTGGALPQGVAVGTVNGFGSVIIDGVRFDDHSIAAVTEVEPGIDVAAEVQLGERVEVRFDTPGVAASLRVEATLVGAVSSVLSSSQFKVLGQTVQINTTATNGPVTQFAGGYLSAADVTASDAVEVHGLIVRQGTGFVIQATRIEKKTALPTYLRITGLVSSLGSSGTNMFKLSELNIDANTATVLPAGHALANDQLVSVWAQPSALSTVGSGVQTLNAAQVRIRSLPTDGNETYLSGSISELNTTAHIFRLAGQLVRYAGATIAPAGTTLTNTSYVRVHGSLQADGSLLATSVTLRDGRDEAEAELKGTLSAYNASAQTFTVRDVLVDANFAAVSGCSATGLRNGLYVEVEGALGPTGVIATSVHCEAEPLDAVIEREGTAATVDLSAKTFVLTLDGTSSSTLTVSWTAETFFRSLTADTLDGKKVGVEGELVGGVLVASKIKLED